MISLSIVIALFLLCGVLNNIKVFSQMLSYLILATTLKASRINTVIPDLHLKKLRETCPRTQRFPALFIDYAASVF